VLIYARTKMTQRTVTHVGAVNLVKHLSGDKLGSKFFSKRSRKENKGGIIFRLDDMLEIWACYEAKNPGKRVPNAISKGFKSAIEDADTYELAKYQAKTRDLSLIDIVNMVHPVESEKNGYVEISVKDYEESTKGSKDPKVRERSKEYLKIAIKDKVRVPALHALMLGLLKQFNTVEDKNTKVGQEVAAKVKSGEITKEEAKVELREAKEDNYSELIKNRKIGYLALLRNLRNILKNTKDKTLISGACELLTDEKLIKQSLVFPHQIDIALEIMLLEFSVSEMMAFSQALNKAYELAIPNLTELFPYGKTAVIWDTSGSMSGGMVSDGSTVTHGWGIGSGSKGRFNKTPSEKASLIGATLAKGIGADLYHFASGCEQIRFNPNDSVNTIKNLGISMSGRVGHGTDFQSIFTKIGNRYDRVFIISDMQGRDYVERMQHNNMHVYCIDIVGYGTTMFKPGSKVYGIYGYSAEIYELIKKVEQDPKALLAEIEAIEI
jgi:hypothetical protein